MKLQLLAVALAGALSQSALAQDIALESEKDKLSYGLGMMIGERVLNNYGELNYDLLMKAMVAQNEGNETAISIQEAQDILQSHQMKAAEAAAAIAKESAAEAKAAGEKFLADNAARDGVTVTASGLQYEVVEAAEGAKPTVEDTVTVHYSGTLINGTVFDSSYQRGEPFDFQVRGVIPGWTEGLQLMSVGSKFRFVIPSELAYGERGAGPDIGPDETLVFDVELLEIKGK